MIKVVLDTNIVVSANLKAAGLEAVVLRLATNLQLQMYITPPILAEYEKVLRRPKLKLTPERIEAVLKLISDRSIMLTELSTVSESNHEDDNRFLECAEAARAHFLVTGNTKHFPSQWKTTQRVTARQLLELIGPGLVDAL